VIPVDPVQPGPAPLDAQMNLPEEQPQEPEQPKDDAPKAEDKPAKKDLDQVLKDAFRKGREAAEKKVEEQPPEEAPQEKAKAEEKPQPQRREDGKFAPKEPQAEQRPTSFREPPQRFDDEAKREWET